MAISDTIKVDLLFKRIGYGMTETTHTGKAPYEETIGSPLTVYDTQIWSQASSIPSSAPNSTTGVVAYYSTTTAVRATPDPSVAGNKTWIMTSTFNNLSTRLGDWISPAVDATYLVTIYNGDPNAGGTPINQGVNGFEWIFDYSAGILYFPNSLPAGLTQVWIVGHRYVGTKGVSGAGVNSDYVEVVYADATVTSGTATFTNFFAFTPNAESEIVRFNSVVLSPSNYSISGLNLILNITNIGYTLEAGDVISATYTY